MATSTLLIKIFLTTLGNYQNQSGELHIDYIKVTEFNNGGGSTKITGDELKEWI